MTRQELRERQAKIYGEFTDLLTICQSLRTGLNGSADIWPDEDATTCIEFLEATAVAWQPSVVKAEEEIDKAILGLIQATVRYASQRRMELL